MVAVISSTLIPQKVYSLYSADERLTQTVTTIEKLKEFGFEKIYLFDNSIQPINTERLKQADGNIFIHQTPQYSFENKGLNEALLLLNNIHLIPTDTPIFKISGRYFPNPGFSKNTFLKHPDKDFIGIGYNFNKRICNFSTKAYFVKNASVLQNTLHLAVEDMIAYSKGIHGIKSIVNSVYDAFVPQPGTNFQLSLEQSFARIIKKKYTYELLTEMHIGGFEAGITVKKKFSE